MFREKLNIRVDDYISELAHDLEYKLYIPEEDDETVENSHTPRGKARLVLNRFVKTGWIDKEYDKFEEVIALRSYAISVLNLLSEMGKDASHEYDSYVFTTYSVLREAMAKPDGENLHNALLSASKNTKQFQTALRTLYHGIRGFLRDIIKQNDVNLLLENRFGRFLELSNMYNTAKTTDSFFRYKSYISDFLLEILSSESHLQPISEHSIKKGRHENISQAEEEIIGIINSVLDLYHTSLEELVNDVDRKHSEYNVVSTQIIQYRSNSDQSAKGNLTEILKSYAAADAEKREKIAEIMERNISAMRHEYFDVDSLYHKPVRNRRILKESLAIKPKSPPSESAKRNLLSQLKNQYSSAKIKEFVEGLLHNKSEIVSNDISVANDTEFILLILAVIRQNDRGMPYTVELTDDSRIERNGYYIPNLTIRK